MVMNELKKLGLRLTPQRMAILKILEGNTTHPAAEEIFHQLMPQYPSLSIATVYNTLEILVKAGKLQEIRISSDKRHFDPNPVPHSHFLCRKCDAIFDLDNGSLDIEIPSNMEGHLVEDCAHYYYGICRNCRDERRDK
ncbi:MAG: Fur family transcriptional regulator [Desulfitobacteriaceae bacterium]|nr:Fur family transcriptional regulator [Desulfitobacteriaceae bacterium]